MSTTGKPSGPCPGLDNAFLDRRDVVAWDRAANDAVGKRETRPARQRLDLDRDAGELSVTAALALEAGMLLRRPADRLLVGHRRRVPDNRQIVPVAQPVDRDLQMYVALAPKYHLAQLGRSAKLQCRVFSRSGGPIDP